MIRRIWTDADADADADADNNTRISFRVQNFAFYPQSHPVLWFQRNLDLERRTHRVIDVFDHIII